MNCYGRPLERHLTTRTVLLVELASAKRVSELMASHTVLSICRNGVHATSHVFLKLTKTKNPAQEVEMFEVSRFNLSAT